MSRISWIIGEIVSERERQEAKWGEQNHDMADWYTILGEEFGELGKAIREYKLQKIVPSGRIREELVQVAAVAVAMLESFDRIPPALVEDLHRCLDFRSETVLGACILHGTEHCIKGPCHHTTGIFIKGEGK